MRRSQQIGGVTTRAIGKSLQTRQLADPVYEHNGESRLVFLFQSVHKRSAHTQPDEVQAEKNGENAQGGAEKILGLDSQHPLPGQPGQCAGQDAQGVQKGADHFSDCGADRQRKQFPSPTPPSNVLAFGYQRKQLAVADKKSPWVWVPTLYLAEGLPLALVLSVAVVLYKNLGVTNREIAFYTSLLYLPWTIKPLWSPLVDLLRTRRLWIWTMEFTVGLGLAGVALAIATPHFQILTLVFFWLVAFASATHDIAADGFYLLALPERQQASFSGVRNTFYRVANIAAQGGLILLVGWAQARTGSYVTAWTLAFALMAVILMLLGGYHRLILPRPLSDRAGAAGSHEQLTAGSREPQAVGSREALAAGFVLTIVEFFRKPKILTLLAFLLLYRFGEAQLASVSKLFLLDARAAGGLALSDDQYGWLYGIVGVAALLGGGLLGGWVVSRHGLKIWLWPMLLAIHLPDAIFIWLAWARPANLMVIGAGVAIEQFGYGFGFAAFMLYMIYIARGPHATAHYAICTGFMAAGMMLPGLWSGWLQQQVGYQSFFIWVILATIPSFLVTAKIPLTADFGRRNENT